MTVSETQHFKTELPGIYPSIFSFGLNWLKILIVSAVWIMAGYLVEIWYILKNIQLMITLHSTWILWKLKSGLELLELINWRANMSVKISLINNYMHLFSWEIATKYWRKKLSKPIEICFVLLVLLLGNPFAKPCISSYKIRNNGWILTFKVSK